MTWMPPGADPEKHRTLVPGVPVWMDASLKSWFIRQFTTTSRSGYNSPDVGLMRLFDMGARNEQPYAEILGNVGPERFYEAIGEEQKLELTDFLVYQIGVGTLTEDKRRSLAEIVGILQAASSEWRVGTRNGNTGLERRVPEGVQAAAESAITSTGTAGQLLEQAWHAAFGRVPDTEEAYEKAIKAVEEAGVAVVIPKNPKATLGTMTSAMEQQGDWKLELTEGGVHPSADVAVRMARALWDGQESRHGGNGYRKPTQGEAEAAVLLAVPLVQFFASGAVARR